MALLGRGVYFTFPFANAAFIGERRLKEKIRYINVVDFMVDLKGYHYMIQRYLKYLYSVLWCQIIFVFEIMTPSNGENCVRMPQIHEFEKEVTSELCWKKRLRTFEVWDWQNARQNGSPTLFRSMEINYHSQSVHKFV